MLGNKTRSLVAWGACRATRVASRFAGRSRRARALYLDLLEATLVGAVYRDDALEPGSSTSTPHDAKLRGEGKDWPALAQTMIGRKRMRNLRSLVERILADGIPGDLIETGVWRGGACIYMRGILAAHGCVDRRVWVADSFCGLPPADPQRYPPDAGDTHHTFKELSVPIDEVRANFDAFGLLDQQVRFLPGWFEDTLGAAPIERLALLRLDGDMYGSTLVSLESLYDRVSPGGFVIVDDYALPGSQQAVDEFRRDRGIEAPLERIDWTGVYWQKGATPTIASTHDLEALTAAGGFVPPGHFYSPLPNFVEIARDEARIFGGAARDLPGVDMNDALQLELLEAFTEFYAELPFKDDPGEGLRYGFVNDSYSYSDAIVLYSMIRQFQPRRIVEVGCGNSSCVILDTNERFFEDSIQCTFIEPFPEFLFSLLKPGDRERRDILTTRVQDLPLQRFEALERNDILFVDSTHVSKVGSDVNHLVFEVLPRLAPGVLIHFHDVFHPFEYPRPWVMEGRAWNEIYLLRAFLQFNSAFEVVFSTTYMVHAHAARFLADLPLCAKNSGGSLWLRRR